MSEKKNNKNVTFNGIFMYFSMRQWMISEQLILYMRRDYGDVMCIQLEINFPAPRDVQSKKISLRQWVVKELQSICKRSDYGAAIYQF